MKKEEYSYSDILMDVLNYFVKKENINVLNNTDQLVQVCNDVRKGKRYSINGYRLDIIALIYALLENSLLMNQITKSYVSDLSKEEIDYHNIQDCNLLSEAFYNTDDLDSFMKLLLHNDDYFSSLVNQFIEVNIIEPSRKKKEVEVLKQVANKSNYLKELEKEKERYYYLSQSIIETNQRHGSRATRMGLLHYVETGEAKGLSNTKYRHKLDSYSLLERKTIFFDYFIREYNTMKEGEHYNKYIFIEQLKKDSSCIYDFEIPEEWYIEYVNDTVNGLYQEIDKNSACYKENMETILAIYHNKKMVEKRR